MQLRENRQLMNAFEILRGLVFFSGGFYGLELSMREEILANLLVSPVNAIRSAARKLRFAYLIETHSSSLGRSIAGAPPAEEVVDFGAVQPLRGGQALGLPASHGLFGLRCARHRSHL